MVKRFIAILLVTTMMAACLVACGNSENESVASSESSEELSYSEQQEIIADVTGYIQQNTLGNIYNLLYGGGYYIGSSDDEWLNGWLTVNMTSGEINVHVRVLEYYCIPYVARELIPIVKAAVENIGRDLNEFDFMSYRENNVEGTIDGSISTWSLNEDCESGIYSSEPDNQSIYDATLSDLLDLYADYESVILSMEGETESTESAESSNLRDSGSCGDDVSWALDNDGMLTISGTGSMKNYDKADDIPWNSLCDTITTVYIEDGVTNIGDNAFYQCEALQEIAIPDSVTSVGKCAFYHCVSLTNVAIPDAVTSIGTSAFNGCSVLSEITIPEGLTSLGSSAFNECSSLTSITIPDGVTEIDGFTFYICSNLESVTMGENIKSLGSCVFSACTNLTEITFRGSAPSIDKNCFSSTVVATAYYPADDPTWTEDILQDYGGNITWVAY